MYRLNLENERNCPSNNLFWMGQLNNEKCDEYQVTMVLLCSASKNLLN
jgi:hypothetical protein